MATELKLPGTSLGDYGKAIYEKYHFTCIYCGFDGRIFDSWMQLSIDHILPRVNGGTNDPSNLVVACRACNSITSRMRFAANDTSESIINQKRQRVAERREIFYQDWMKTVAPLFLKRPLPKIGNV